MHQVKLDRSFSQICFRPVLHLLFPRYVSAFQEDCFHSVVDKAIIFEGHVFFAANPPTFLRHPSNSVSHFVVVVLDVPRSLGVFLVDRPVHWSNAWHLNCGDRSCGHLYSETQRRNVRSELCLVSKLVKDFVAVTKGHHLLYIGDEILPSNMGI